MPGSELSESRWVQQFLLIARPRRRYSDWGTRPFILFPTVYYPYTECQECEFVEYRGRLRVLPRRSDATTTVTC